MDPTKLSFSCKSDWKMFYSFIEENALIKHYAIFAG